MRLALLSRRPIALLAATALLTGGGVATGLFTGTAYAATTITSVTNPVNNSNKAAVQVQGTGVNPAEPITITATDSLGAAAPAVSTNGSPSGTFSGELNLTTLRDGVIRVTASGPLSGSSSRDVVKDTVAPAAPTNLTSNPATTVNASQQTSVVVSAQAASDATSVRLTIRAPAGTPRIDIFPSNAGGTYTATFDITTLPQGSLTVEAAAIDAAGNEATATKTITKDTIAPSFATYAFTGVETTPNRVNATKPGPGNKVGVTVSATDPAPAAPGNITFVTTITDSAGTAATFTPVNSSATSASFSFDPYVFADGTLTLSTVPTDAAGNAGAPGTTTLAKDTTVPSVTGLTITPSPINNTGKANVVVSGRVAQSAGATAPSESGTTVTITPSCTPTPASGPPIGGTPAGTVPPAKTVTAAADGTFSASFDATGCTDGVDAFTVTAVATDPGKNVSPTVTAKANKDTMAPGNPAIGSLDNAVKKPGFDNTTALPFSGTSEAGTTVKVTIRDEAGKTVVVSVVATGANTFSGTADVSGLADGTLSATATATDVAGNESGVSNTRTSNKDTTAFELVSTTPTEGSTTGPGTTVQATYNEPLNLASSSIVLRTKPGNVPVAGNTSYANGSRTIIFTPNTPLPSGDYAATIVGKESGAGDDPAITTVLNFTVDASAPASPVITSLTNPINKANQTAVHAVGTAQAGSTVRVTLTGGAVTVTGTGVATPTGTFDVTLDATTLPDGSVSATATATDAGGTSAPSGSRTATKDTVAPTVTGTNATDTTQAQRSTTVTATSSESGNAVRVTLTDKDGTTVTGDGTSGAMGAISIVIDTTTLADGPVTASVVATDGAGNPSAPGTKTFTKDTTGPAVTGLAATTVNSASAGRTTVSGSTGEPGSVTVTVSDGTTSRTGTASTTATGAFSFAIDVSVLADGTLTVTAVGRDARSNAGATASSTVLKDTVKPVVTGLTATATSGTNATTTVSGQTDGSIAVRITVTDGNKSAEKTVTSAANGSFSTTFDLTGYRSGALPVTATATDAAGNVGDTATTTANRDATGPTITNLQATAVSSTSPVSTVTGTVDDGKATVALKATDKNGATKTGTATVSGNGSFSGTLDLSGLAVGTITVQATATDELGNVGATASTTTTKTDNSTVPTAPRNVAATPGDGRATVTWTAPASDGGSPVTSYTVTVSPAAGTVTYPADRTQTGATVTGLTNGTSYTFSVVATNAKGNSPAATSSAVTPAGPPASPTGVSATAGDGAARVSFTPPTSNGGSAITSYRVTSTPGGITKTGSSSPITVTGLTNGTSYTFTVRASSSAGNSPESAPSNAVTPRPGPTGSTVVGLNGATGTIRFGTALALTGRVVRGDKSTPIGVVSVLVRADDGTSRTLFRLRPSSTGDYIARTLPSNNGVYTIRYDGDANNPVASSTGRRINVAVRITVRAPATALSSPLVVSGVVGPVKAGRTVVLYRVVSGSLQRLGSGVIASDGSYRISVRLARGTYTLEVGLGATPGNAAGASRFSVTRS